MALTTINDSHLSSIAAAIRTKNGETTTYKPSEMAAAISAIEGGGSSGSRQSACESIYVASGTTGVGTTLPMSKASDVWALVVHTSNASNYLFFKGQEDLDITTSLNPTVAITKSGGVASISNYTLKFEENTSGTLGIKVLTSSNSVLGGITDSRVIYWKDEGAE